MRLITQHQTDIGLLDRLAHHQAAVDDIDDQLHADRTTRARIARLHQPDPIIEILGPRPPGPHAPAWDHAAEQLAQHHAAYQIDHGLGPPPGLHRHDAYTTSRHHTAQITAPFRPRHPTPQPARDLGIDSFGIEL